MKIDDILKKGPKDLESYLIKEMYDTAGKDLVKKMVRFFGSINLARDWFYTPLIPLNYLRPYDYCKGQKNSEIDKLLDKLDKDIYTI